MSKVINVWIQREKGAIGGAEYVTPKKSLTELFKKIVKGKKIEICKFKCQDGGSVEFTVNEGGVDVQVLL